MNEIANKFLLVGDKFMSEVHLKQLGFTYNDCGQSTKSKERIQEIQDIFSEMNQIKLVFKMIWLMQILKI